jgi:hypothetical protein
VNCSVRKIIKFFRRWRRGRWRRGRWRRGRWRPIGTQMEPSGHELYTSGIIFTRWVWALRWVVTSFGSSGRIDVRASPSRQYAECSLASSAHRRPPARSPFVTSGHFFIHRGGILARNLKNPRAADPGLEVKKLGFPWHRSTSDSSATSNSAALLQLRVLRLGFLQDGNVGVGVFPEAQLQVH